MDAANEPTDGHDQAALLDQTLKRLNVKNDRALAKLWDIPQGSLSMYRHQKRLFEPYVLHKIAEALDLDPRQITARLELTHEKKPAKRAYWEELLKKPYGVMCIGVFTALCIDFGNTMYMAPNAESNSDNLYIIRNWLRDLIRWLDASSTHRPNARTAYPTPCAIAP